MSLFEGFADRRHSRSIQDLADDFRVSEEVVHVLTRMVEVRTTL